MVFFFPLSVWFYVGMAGAFCFILIQLVLLIDFAHSWNESWVEKMEEGNSRCWYAGKVFFCLNKTSSRQLNFESESRYIGYGEITIFMVQFLRGGKVHEWHLSTFVSATLFVELLACQQEHTQEPGNNPEYPDWLKQKFQSLLLNIYIYIFHSLLSWEAYIRLKVKY